MESSEGQRSPSDPPWWQENDEAQLELKGSQIVPVEGQAVGTMTQKTNEAPIEKAKIKRVALRDRIEAIKNMPEGSRTNEEVKILERFEIKRLKKNEASKKRYLHQKREVERILSMPVKERSPFENEVVKVYFERLDNKRKTGIKRRLYMKWGIDFLKKAKLPIFGHQPVPKPTSSCTKKVMNKRTSDESSESSLGIKSVEQKLLSGNATRKKKQEESFDIEWPLPCDDIVMVPESLTLVMPEASQDSEDESNSIFPFTTTFPTPAINAPIPKVAASPVPGPTVTVPPGTVPPVLVVPTTMLPSAAPPVPVPPLHIPIPVPVPVPVPIPLPSQDVAMFGVGGNFAAISLNGQTNSHFRFPVPLPMSLWNPRGPAPAAIPTALFRHGNPAAFNIPNQSLLSLQPPSFYHSQMAAVMRHQAALRGFVSPEMFGVQPGLQMTFNMGDSRVAAAHRNPDREEDDVELILPARLLNRLKGKKKNADAKGEESKSQEVGQCSKGIISPGEAATTKKPKGCALQIDTETWGN